MRKECLNLGSFTVQIPSNNDESWMNIDIIGDERTFNHASSHQTAFLKHDLRKGIPYEDKSKDTINMSHLLEHFTVPEGVQLLKECYRVLRPGGILRVCVPDTEKLIDAYVGRDMQRFDHIQPDDYKPCSQSEKFWRMITSNPPEYMGTPQWEGHKTAYDDASLNHALSEAGFINKKTVEFDKKYDTFPEVALCMTAEKPGVTVVDRSIIITENNRW